MEHEFFMQQALALAREAAAHGVELWAVGCRVTENTLTADSPIPVEPGFTIHGSHDTMERL